MLVAGAAPSRAGAQDAVTRERAEFTRWLETSPVSPAVAMAHRPVGDGLTLGPETADLPVSGLAGHRLTRSGSAVTLEGPGGRRTLARGRPVGVGPLTIVLGGPRDGPWLTLFDSTAPRRSFPYYPIAPGLSFLGPIDPPGRGTTVRLLTLDGFEVEASEAGSVRVPLGRDTVRLSVRRVPDPATGESELEIYFQDGTSGDGSYPAGRFVTLDPLPDGRYRLDFNRARNPFCAYSTAYPCPVPWPGNRVAVRIEAGERYPE
jgi:hypothetical protein